MTNTPAIRFSDLTPKITEHFPDEDKRITGKPLRISNEYFANLEFGVRSGTWSAPAGSYRLELADSKHEFFHILTGRVLISLPDGSEAVSYGAGDTGIIPPGFKGIFEIVEPASKFWVVTDRAA